RPREIATKHGRNALDRGRTSGDGRLGMTKVEAIIREERLQAVVERLILIGVRGLTVSAARGAGRSGGRPANFRGSAYAGGLLPTGRLEWVGRDEDADAVVRAIQRSAATGEIGDGKIFVVPVEEAVRIRTGERGEGAL